MKKDFYVLSSSASWHRLLRRTLVLTDFSWQQMALVIFIINSLLLSAMNNQSSYYIQQLQLQPHPEGGYYKEVYRSPGMINKDCLPQFDGARNYATSIYFLLEQGNFSAFHTIKSDELWHFYAGETLLIHVIEPGGNYYAIKLGSNLNNGEVFQCVVPAHAWFASEPAPGAAFALVGCTVSPGFDFNDFEMAEKEKMLNMFPQHAKITERLCR